MVFLIPTIVIATFSVIVILFVLCYRRCRAAHRLRNEEAERQQRVARLRRRRAERAAARDAAGIQLQPPWWQGAPVSPNASRPFRWSHAIVQPIDPLQREHGLGSPSPSPPPAQPLAPGVQAMLAQASASASAASRPSTTRKPLPSQTQRSEAQLSLAARAVLGDLEGFDSDDDADDELQLEGVYHHHEGQQHQQVQEEGKEREEEAEQEQNQHAEGVATSRSASTSSARSDELQPGAAPSALLAAAALSASIAPVAGPGEVEQPQLQYLEEDVVVVLVDVEI